jgi:RND superfamily putative drug exporter
MAIPVLHVHTAQSGLEALSRSAPTVETLDRIQEAFPGEASPANIAVQTDTDSTAFKNAANDLRARVVASNLMHGPVEIDVNPTHTVARIDVPLNGNGNDKVSTAALQELRNEIVPATIGTIPDAEYAVTGDTAGSVDFNSAMKRSVPLVFGFVLTFAFLLLLVTFRSIVVAAKAILLNLLSVGAAYGVLVAIFQNGWGEGVLDFKSNGGIASWLPMFMFVILFGLSMDYHVFILSRVREAYDRGMSTDDAVAHGIKTTAGTVTSAAIVMVGAFLIFATLPFLDFKEMGIGLAAAVLIDATIVRAFLLPASMKLLGDWNWYLPKWLEWLPQVKHETQPEAVPVPAAA